MMLKTILVRVVEQLNGAASSGMNPTLTALEIKCLEAINVRYKQINSLSGRGRGLPWMTKRYTFLTTAPVTTGTVTATNASRTVTHSGTSFASGMVGRRFKTDEHDEIYTITQFVSTSEVQIDRNYQGTGGSGLTYTIFQDEYDLPADFDKDLIIVSPDSDGRIQKEGLIDLLDEFSNPYDTGKPQMYAISSHRSREAAVTTLTGTLTFTDASRTVTATGGAFTTELRPGDLIRKETAQVTGTESGTLWRTVDTITNDNTLTLTQAWDGTTGTTTTAQRQDGWLRLRFQTIPDDATLMTLYYTRWLTDLRDLSNIPEMPDRYHPALIDGPLIDLFEDQDDPRVARMEARWDQWIRELKRDYGLASQRLRLTPALTNPRIR